MPRKACRVCTKCYQKGGTTKQEVDSFHKSHLTENTKWMCWLCKKLFKRKQELWQQMVHSNDFRQVCAGSWWEKVVSGSRREFRSFQVGFNENQWSRNRIYNTGA